MKEADYVGETREEVLGQFLGDEDFPITWDSDLESQLFWVYDDLHSPHPLSPMYFDIGGWWLSCDHMFRRFGTPFASDWIAKNVNGYLYTAAVPADPAFHVDSAEYGARYGARTPLDPAYAQNIGSYLDAVLPVYGREFDGWWRDRFVPEMQRNFAYLEAQLERRDDLALPELACLLEDAIDIHDRHWKIHWMLNFAQLSGTLRLRSVAERVHGRVDEALLGRLQNSARDRNWDSIQALWRMKEEVRADPELAAAFEQEDARSILTVLAGSDRGRTFLEGRVLPYQREFGWHAVWSHELIFPTVREHAEPVIDSVREYLQSDYNYAKANHDAARDLASASEELLAGLSGDALAAMRDALEMNAKLAPLTPDHHFYIDQGTNAHLRLVLIAIGEKLVAEGVCEAPDDVMFLKYNELREVIGDRSVLDVRGVTAQRRAERERQYRMRARDWIGTATQSQLDFPYLVNWGFPEKFYRTSSPEGNKITGIAASAGIVEGIARVVLQEDQFDEVKNGDVVVCQMTNPAWVPLFTRMSGLVTDSGGTTSHSAVLAREFGLPAVVGTSAATSVIRTGDRVRVDGTKGVVEIMRSGRAEPA
jgi:pyruvate,water dikinase